MGVAVRIQGGVTICLTILFIYCGTYAHWFDVIETWTWETKAIVSFVALIAFTSHNEFFGGHK